MKHTLLLRAGRLWCAGLVLFLLRLVQNMTGFDPETGLSLPSLPGTALVVCLALLVVWELLRIRKLDKTKAPFSRRFAAPDKETAFLAAGSLLLVAGGLLMAMSGFGSGGGEGVAAIAAGVTGAVSGGCILMLGKQMRDGGEVTVGPLLPAMFFGVFLVLAIYLPAADDPVLARYWLPVLSSAMAAYAFSQMAGFLRGESSPRGFTPVANLAVILCLASLADGGLGQALLLGGCALVLTVFLLLQRDTPQAPAQKPEPAEEPEV